VRACWHTHTHTHTINEKFQHFSRYCYLGTGYLLASTTKALLTFAKTRCAIRKSGGDTQPTSHGGGEICLLLHACCQHAVSMMSG
jgi:hypothetical protein